LEHSASNPVSIKNLNATETSATASDGDRNYNDDISYGKDMTRDRKGRATEQLVKQEMDRLGKDRKNIKTDARNRVRWKKVFEALCSSENEED
jgi:hypothetical protein